MKKTFNLRPITKRLPLCLFAFVLLSCTTPQAAVTPFQNNTVPEKLGEPALVNLNGYYFLYMHPISPFKSNGRVFVPLYRFSALLNVVKDYEYGQDPQHAPISAIIARGDIELSINNKSVVTITNTQTGQKTTPAYSGTETVWREVEDNLYGVYVALDIFKDAFGIEVQYDATRDTHYVVDTQSNFTEDLPIDKLVYKVQSTPIIHPTKVSLEVTNKPTLYEYSEFRLTLEIKTPDDFTGNVEDISIALIGHYDSATTSFSGDSTIRPFTCQTSTQKNTFVCTENFTPDQAISPLRDIFSRIGVRIK
jgi:hypothetical protein